MMRVKVVTQVINKLTKTLMMKISLRVVRKRVLQIKEQQTENIADNNNEKANEIIK